MDNDFAQELSAAINDAYKELHSAALIATMMNRRDISSMILDALKSVNAALLQWEVDYGQGNSHFRSAGRG